MAHELTIHQDGQVEHAYVGAIGWHKLGNQLAEGASIEQWMQAAGMDWQVQQAPVSFNTGGESAPIAFPGRVALYRSDNYFPLGVVGKGYKPVHPGEALEFFRDLTDFKLDTAGTLKGGKKYWALAKVGESFVRPNDKIQGHLLFATSADGSMGTVVKFVATRVVCNNTLTAALGENGREQFVVSHRSEFDPERVKDALALRGELSLSQYIQEARALADRPVNVFEAEDFVAKLLGIEYTKADNTPKAFQKIISLFYGEGMGSKLVGTEGTAWGLVNAATEYVDHHVKARSLDNRMDSAWFGSGAQIKAKAMQMAQELVAA